MPSIPLTAEEERKVLATIGLQSIEDLFSSVPPKIREAADFKLDMGQGYVASGKGLTEHELRSYFGKLAAKNASAPQYQHFLGGGIYDNVIPAIVNQLVLRGEFLTCYTPYQPEISQGTLQAIFEFQTMIARMTGMEVANASMYDGATATAEAVLMAQRLSTPERQSVLVAESLTPEYQHVLHTFLKSHSVVPTQIAWTPEGTTDLKILEAELKRQEPCAVVIPSPNYFGVVEPIEQIKRMLPKGCLLIVAVSDPSSFSIFEAPGKLGADIVVGEAHQLGTPMLFGGPHVGFFASKKEYLRQMPGRLCGETVDASNKRAYTLTLSTREQHIRREKATSNICTNQGLIALRTTIYLSFLGKQGFQRLGQMNYSLFDYLTSELQAVGIPLQFKGGVHYREGVFRVPNLKERFAKAVDRKIVPGIAIGEKFPSRAEDFKNSLLICAHPKHSKEDIDALVEVISHD